MLEAGKVDAVFPLVVTFEKHFYNYQHISPFDPSKCYFSFEKKKHATKWNLLLIALAFHAIFGGGGMVDMRWLSEQYCRRCFCLGGCVCAYHLSDGIFDVVEHKI